MSRSLPLGSPKARPGGAIRAKRLRDEGGSPHLMAWSIYLNVVIQGVLTGLVYGLMALGLSVIFGVVRVVNFAHGEFAVVAMYVAFLLFRRLRRHPLRALL